MRQNAHIHTLETSICNQILQIISYKLIIYIYLAGNRLKCASNCSRNSGLATTSSL
ncbi:hypothetical protein HanXRQr2_Chr05g0236031 [Helianthus annuus]|uniref:Uncharacterized protein n=1 Tax=Helianthus annuus TaxID=4232 RepID=A0A9K3NQE4_HELAN|nr:hypothetical protein HanXRQr2_Chr05g0236031 [Helianthus annuus]KAJ0924399.1 hypothetical protein HanPSC8_Chr05g0227711 [Helianthus annuus]